MKNAQVPPMSRHVSSTLGICSCTQTWTLWLRFAWQLRTSMVAAHAIGLARTLGLEFPNVAPSWSQIPTSLRLLQVSRPFPEHFFLGKPYKPIKMRQPRPGQHCRERLFGGSSGRGEQPNPGRNYIRPPPLPPIEDLFQGEGGGVYILKPRAAGFYTPPPSFIRSPALEGYSHGWGGGGV